MKQEFIKELHHVCEWLDRARVVKDSDWVRVFCEIAQELDKSLPEWHCIIETSYESITKVRLHSLTIAKYYPRIRNFSVWERHTCKDERLLTVPDVGHQRQELKRKLKKIAKILENGIS